MTGTNSHAERLRAHLDATQPGWQESVRADLDKLTPDWESFPLHVWDESTESWVEIVLLANPEPVTPPKGVLWKRVLRRWFGRQ